LTKASKFFPALIVTIAILSVIAGALLEYFAISFHSSPTTITMTSPIVFEKTSTVYKTENETSTLVVIQIVSNASTVTSTEYNEAIPPYVEIRGTVDSQDYFPVSVYFEHCLPAAFVQCDTYPRRDNEIR
jgi:hypothetical protein